MQEKELKVAGNTYLLLKCHPHCDFATARHLCSIGGWKFASIIQHHEQQNHWNKWEWEREKGRSRREKKRYEREWKENEYVEKKRAEDSYALWSCVPLYSCNYCIYSFNILP